VIHEQFDMERWIREFSLDRLKKEARASVEKRRQESPERYPDDDVFEYYVRLAMPGASYVCGPEHAAVNEQIRRAVFGVTEPEDADPTDIFVWGSGEPSRRDVTKIAGLPYWPSDRPWPASESGVPMIFLAQFNFGDSLDIVDDLPGQLLLIFDKGEAFDALELADLHFEWIDPFSGPPVTTAPREDEAPIARWGQIFRTYDWADVAEDLNDAGIGGDLAVLKGTKIGGLPSWIQSPEEGTGRYIATLGSISSLSDTWPFVNAKSQPRSRGGQRDIMWGDMGNLYLFLDDDETVVATFDCY
jgi:hypothetical protein